MVFGFPPECCSAWPGSPFFDETSENCIPYVADEQQKKAALQTMEPVVISTNHVTGRLMRSKPYAFDPGELSANQDPEIGVS
jgi:hypothetical protein